ncbi:MAG TPA: DEAD/DEAH box helicase [Firmicutes bacterium]|nr:DEAD/DEAH box helicase [Bacillota bacterium]
MDVGTFINRITAHQQYAGQLVHLEVLPTRQAVFQAPAQPLPEPVAQALAGIGINRLYSHQALAVDLAREGRHFVVVTGTASGKTLCYHLPVLEGLLQDAGGKALYLFPTKALAQDQLRGLLQLKELCPDLPLCAGTYDGDTPPAIRRRLKSEGNCILTNPDMLHSGILPNHAGWGEFFASLRWIIIDEIHTYRGIFGSHVANVIRRLKRVCRHYGSNPQFFCSSATIANPKELAEKLTGETVVVIDDDGSPRGRKYFAFWNPPRFGETMERRSPFSEATVLMTELIKARHPTIAFSRTRIGVELLYRYTRQELQRLSPTLAGAIRAYRGGYLPAERRRIEQQLFSGELLGVTSTNALELGIDIGSLDACLMVGFPGSIASAWQQAGRAGRGGDDALVVFIAQNAPLDQYLMMHPHYFFESSCEHATVDPDNPYVALNHLRAAIFELPLRVDKEEEFGPMAPALVELLLDLHQIVRRGNSWYWVGKGFPADDFSLRTAGDDTYTIIDTTEGKNVAIGSTCELTAFTQLYTEAIYLHDGEPYFVSKLDTAEKAAYVHRVDPDYYTQSITDRRVRIQAEELSKEWRKSRVSFGDVDVTYITYMYKKVKFADRDSLGFGRIDLPPIVFDTCAMWLSPSLEAFRQVRAAGLVPSEGMAGVANVIGEVLPLFAMCDPSDIGTAVDSSNTGVPTLFVFDRYKGGAGFAQKAYELVEEVLAACCRLILDCSCADGCPSCVGAPVPPFPGIEVDSEAKGRIPDKEAALVILHALLERPYVPQVKAGKKAYAGGTAAAGGAGRAGGAAPPVESEELIERRPAEPLPENLEIRLRQQITRLQVTNRHKNQGA